MISRKRLLAFAVSGFLLACLFTGCYTVSSLKARMPQDAGVVVAPSEGHVLVVIPDLDPADPRLLQLDYLDKQCSFPELSPFVRKGSKLVVVFMKLYHKHVTVSPIAGSIREIHYVPGGFQNIFLPDAYKENEHNTIVIEGDISIAVVQIAGLVARKISCDVSSGQAVERGDKLGHIKFGSAVAILLPPECQLAVQQGQKVDTAKDIIATYTP